MVHAAGRGAPSRHENSKHVPGLALAHAGAAAAKESEICDINEEGVPVFE